MKHIKGPGGGGLWTSTGMSATSHVITPPETEAGHPRRSFPALPPAADSSDRRNTGKEGGGHL